MESTSVFGNESGAALTADEARAALDQVERAVGRAEEAAYAPTPLPRWYWITVATAIGTMWAVNDADSLWLRLPALVVYAAVMGVAVRKVVERNAVLVKVHRMPWRLAAASCAPILGFLALTGAVGLATSLAGWPHPWLIVGACAFVGVLIGGPLSERSYQRAYARWLASRSAS